MAGLEPTISESKSEVLPLHYIPPSVRYSIVHRDRAFVRPLRFVGWVKGLEPSISRATIWRLSQLGHTHHARGNSIELNEPPCKNFSKKSLKLAANVCPLYACSRLCGAAYLSCRCTCATSVLLRALLLLRCTHGIRYTCTTAAPAPTLLLRCTHGIRYTCTAAAPRPRYSCGAPNVFPCSSSARKIILSVKQ